MSTNKTTFREKLDEVKSTVDGGERFARFLDEGITPWWDARYIDYRGRDTIYLDGSFNVDDLQALIAMMQESSE